MSFNASSEKNASLRVRLHLHELTFAKIARHPVWTPRVAHRRKRIKPVFGNVWLFVIRCQGRSRGKK